MATDYTDLKIDTLFLIQDHARLRDKIIRPQTRNLTRKPPAEIIINEYKSVCENLTDRIRRENDYSKVLLIKRLQEFKIDSLYNYISAIERSNGDPIRKWFDGEEVTILANIQRAFTWDRFSLYCIP